MNGGLCDLPPDLFENVIRLAQADSRAVWSVRCTCTQLSVIHPQCTPTLAMRADTGRGFRCTAVRLFEGRRRDGGGPLYHFGGFDPFLSSHVKGWAMPGEFSADALRVSTQIIQALDWKKTTNVLLSPEKIMMPLGHEQGHEPSPCAVYIRVLLPDGTLLRGRDVFEVAPGGATRWHATPPVFENTERLAPLGATIIATLLDVFDENGARRPCMLFYSTLSPPDEPMRDVCSSLLSVVVF